MQTTWGEGYVTDIGYTYGYYRDLSPNFQKFCLLLAGFDSLDFTPDSQHCELGFGQGVSVNIHAATTVGRFFGTDFNPTHAAHANKIASASGHQAQLFDDSFEQLLNRTDLPLFDSISLHGIWSWISTHNQHILLKFLGKYLKPGGVVYISYNCLPGMSATLPLKELFNCYTELGCTETNLLARVSATMNFTQTLFDAEPAYVKASPQIVGKFNDIKTKDPYYLAHEYFNQDWQTFSFFQITRLMNPAKLEYKTTSDLLNLIDSINLTPQATAFLETIENRILREQTKDYFFNRQFRKDLYQRGSLPLTKTQQVNKLKATRFVLLYNPENVAKTVDGHAGRFDLRQEIYQPILAELSKDQSSPKTLALLCKQLSHIPYEQILDALVILIALNYVSPCQTEDMVVQVKDSCQRFNQYILDQALDNANITFLASPLTGSGISASRIVQIFLYAYSIERIKDTADLAQYCWAILKAQNLLVLDNNRQAIQTEEGNLSHLNTLANSFINETLVIMAAHGIVDL
jgi:SAM-dependent methyltransferase